MSKRFILIGVLVLVVGGIGSWYLQKTLLHQAQYMGVRETENVPAPAIEPEASTVVGPSTRVRLAIGGLGLPDDQQNGRLADLVVAELSSENGIELVERQALRAVLKEAELSLSGLVRAGDAIRVGRLVRADWFLLGSPTRLNGTNAVLARIVDARSGIIRDFALLTGTTQTASFGADLARFVRRARQGASQARPHDYLAIGHFQDLSMNNRYPSLSADLRRYLAGSFHNTNVVMVEREAVNALLQEMRLDLAGFTDRGATNAVRRAQFAFWLVDGVYQSYEVSGPEVDLVLRVTRVFSSGTRKALRDRPGEPLFRHVAEEIDAALARTDLTLQPPGREQAVRAQIIVGQRLSGLSQSALIGGGKFWSSWHRYVPNGEMRLFTDSSAGDGPWYTGDKVKTRHNLEAAIEAFETAILLDPDSSEAKLYLAICLRNQIIDRVEEARNYYREIIGSPVQDSWTLMARKALAFSYVEEDDQKMAELFEDVARHTTGRDADSYRQAAKWTQAVLDKMNPDADATLLAAEKKVADSMEKGLANTKKTGAPITYDLNPLYESLWLHGQPNRKIIEFLPQWKARFPELAPYLVAALVDDSRDTNSALAREFRESLDQYADHPEKLVHPASYYGQLNLAPLRWVSDVNLSDLVVRICDIERRAAIAGFATNKLDVMNQVRLYFAYSALGRYQDALNVLEGLGRNPIEPHMNGPWGDYHLPFLPGKEAALLRRKLRKISPEDDTLFELGPPFLHWNQPITTALEADAVWASDGATLQCFDSAAREIKRIRFPAGKAASAACMVVTPRCIWVGTAGGGLVEYNRDTQECRRFDTADGLLFDEISALHLAENVLWIGFGNIEHTGHAGGLGRMDVATHRFTALTPELDPARSPGVGGERPPNSDVVKICGGPAGEIWVAERQGGIRRYQPRLGLWKGFLSLYSDRGDFEVSGSQLFVAGWTVNMIHNLATHRGWTVDSGLSIYNFTGTNWLTFNTDDGLPAKETTAVALDGKNIWMGGLGFVGLFDVEQKRMSRLCYVKAKVVEALEVANGCLWIQIGKNLYREPLATVMTDMRTKDPQDIALLDAAEAGDTGKATQALAAGARIEARNADGWTPLILAGKAGHTNLMKLLIGKGADVNAKSFSETGSMLLSFATEPDDPAVLQVLLDHGADIDRPGGSLTTPLYSAVIHRKNRAAKYLVERGADVNKFGFRNEADRWLTPLMGAAFADNTEMVGFLLDHGAELDKTNGFGDTALMTASRMPSTASIKLLIERKANVNAVTPQGHSALLYAAYNGHVEIVKLLLAAGANPEAVASENGSSFDPMSVAMQQRHPEVVALLTEALSRGNSTGRKP